MSLARLGPGWQLDKQTYFMANVVSGSRLKQLRDGPFKDEPTEGFIRPCRGAETLLKELHLLLQTL